MRNASALHTLLSLYECTSSITTSVSDGLLFFYFVNYRFFYQSRNDAGS
ncbi:hypothetical protein DFR60_10459 [Hungatella effluvii]|uniref:Uncharacterized protein n=1 Tax=Hungatella effluvii TaxID=1096246 RepID=A0A2V3YKT5_9FIRM|nr:hypothetical protein DFR60_10459 [Hungatella effluvii]